MKTLRTISLLIVAILVLSAWTPSPVSARQADKPVTVAPLSPSFSADAVTTVVVPLYVKNRSGGTLFITLAGPKTYYFTIVDKTAKFLILPGRYRITAISTACSNLHEQRRNFKDGGNLVYYCDSQ
ncbi:MAG: hypothetical protein NT121_09475 [Chloroflexi bacterium]|nr:hypothetical protein [Chloroflexota bacterium]